MKSPPHYFGGYGLSGSVAFRRIIECGMLDKEHLSPLLRRAERVEDGKGSVAFRRMREAQV